VLDGQFGWAILAWRRKQPVRQGTIKESGALADPEPGCCLSFLATHPGATEVRLRILADSSGGGVEDGQFAKPQPMEVGALADAARKTRFDACSPQSFSVLVAFMPNSRAKRWVSARRAQHVLPHSDETGEAVMRIIALAAAASMAFGPSLSMAQTGCPANAIYRDSVCVCADGYSLVSGACVADAPVAEGDVSSEGEASTPAEAQTTAAVEAGGVAELPVLGSIPTGAIIVGGLVVLAGVAIGIAAASSGSSKKSSPTPESVEPMSQPGASVH